MSNRKPHNASGWIAIPAEVSLDEAQAMTYDKIKSELLHINSSGRVKLM